MTRPFRVNVGRSMAAAAVTLAFSAVLILVVISGPDLITLDWVPQMTAVAMGFGVLGWLAIPLQPSNKALWVTTAAALLTGVASAGWAAFVLLGGPAASAPAEAPPLVVGLGLLYDAAGWSGLYMILTVGLLLFPDGQPPSPRWRWVGWLSMAAVIALALVFVWVWRPSSTVELDADTFAGVGRWLEPLIYLLIVLTGVSVGGLFVGYHRSSGAKLQQYRWIAWGGAVLFLSFAAVAVGEVVPGVPSGVWEHVVILIGVLALIGSYGVAVIRYRLHDIDLVISRTLVFGGLAAFIGTVYVIIVVGLGTLIGAGSDSLVLPVVATALVAAAFEPVRQKVQSGANRLVFGMRATPYEVLSDLAHRLAGAEPVSKVMSRMAQLMVEGTGADQATVWLAGDDCLTAASGYPRDPEARTVASVADLDGVAYSVIHDGESVGTLQLIKARGNPVTPPEHRLLADLAASAGLVMGNQRLNAALVARAGELRASRRRLVEIQDLERHRLESDLHDSAQQNVVALEAQVRSVELVARKAGSDRVAELLADIAEDAHLAVEEIHSLARGIYPPLLESEGLESALRALTASLPLPVTVESDLGERLGLETEAAVYFAISEAVSNAMKHGRASSVDIKLEQSRGKLLVIVADDGVGFDAGRPQLGMGLMNMRDRLETLGGTIQLDSRQGVGTRVTAEVPSPAS